MTKGATAVRATAYIPRNVSGTLGSLVHYCTHPLLLTDVTRRPTCANPQSAFFSGYLLMSIPGGYFASRLGGRRWQKMHGGPLLGSVLLPINAAGLMGDSLPSSLTYNLFHFRRLLPVGVAVWSTATAAAPAMAAVIPTLCASRAVVGLGEAVAPVREGWLGSEAGSCVLGCVCWSGWAAERMQCRWWGERHW